MSVNNVYNFDGYSWPENIILIAGDSMIDRMNEKRIYKIFLVKVNNRNTRQRCEIDEKLTIKTPKRCH